MPPTLPARSPDTDPEAERVQIELLRAASPAQRAALARSLTSTVIWLARRAIAQQHPGASEEEIGIRFVALHYGQELADELSAFLQRRRR